MNELEIEVIFLQVDRLPSTVYKRNMLLKVFFGMMKTNQ